MYDVHVNQVKRVQVQIFFWYRDFKALTALNNLVDQVLCFRPKQFFVVYKEIIHAYMSTKFFFKSFNRVLEIYYINYVQHYDN